MTWWETGNVAVASGLKAVIYCRNSAEIGQENSCDIQEKNIRAFAAKNNIAVDLQQINGAKDKLIVTETELEFMTKELNEYIKNYPKRRKSRKDPQAADESIQRLINDSDFFNKTLFDLIEQRRNKK